MLKNESSIVSCRLDPDLKSSWFAVCDQLGLSPSSCITLLAKQMVLRRSLPFLPIIPKNQFDGWCSLSKEEMSELYDSASGGDD